MGVHRITQRAGDLRQRGLGCEVAGFARVAGEVVELLATRLDGADELVAGRPEREAVRKLEVGGAREELSRRRRVVSDQGQQAHALELREGREPEHVADGRHDVDRPDRLGHDPSGIRPIRKAHDERDVQELVVERLAVEEAAMVPLLLAVIRGDDDERVVEEAARRQTVQQAADLGVDEGELRVVEGDDPGAIGRRVMPGPCAADVVEAETDGAGIRGIGEARREGRGRAVGRVGVDVVQVEREGHAGSLIDPLKRVPRHPICAPGPGRRDRVEGVARLEGEPVEEVEVVDDRLRAEHAAREEARDERRPHGGREGRGGEDLPHRGERHGTAREGGGEAHPLGGELIQAGRSRSRVAVGAEMVGAQGVDRDEEEVRSRMGLAHIVEEGAAPEREEAGRLARSRGLVLEAEGRLASREARHVDGEVDPAPIADALADVERAREEPLRPSVGEPEARREPHGRGARHHVLAEEDILHRDPDPEATLCRHGHGNLDRIGRGALEGRPHLPERRAREHDRGGAGA